MKDGVIKFNCNWIKGKAIAIENLYELNKWRNEMFKLGLIGIYPDGVGYGNISERSTKNKFVISGSETGGIKNLSEEHYCVVEEYDFEENSLSCVGPLKASAESLTHAAIYESSPEINGVIHVHNMKLWEYLLDKVPFTGKEIEYGTPEMAEEMKRLIKEKATREKNIIVMKGHKEGVISFGKNLNQAGEILLKYFEEIG
jgi:ribulose-5-phosphate 4-epimerase/fuculose-1-phosphate aldolase